VDTAEHKAYFRQLVRATEDKVTSAVMFWLPKLIIFVGFPVVTAKNNTGLFSAVWSYPPKII
jgi:hypothetical protein